MKGRSLFLVGGLVLGGAISAAFMGCTPNLIANQTEEINGNVTIQFINSTSFRASFSFGSFNAFELAPPGAASFEQLRVEGDSTSATVTVTCRRNVAVGTKDFIERVLRTGADDDATDFDPDAFSENVNFSSADPNSAAAGLPTEGTAAGREVLLGVDFKCGDHLLFTFVEDGAASGGFRIDLRVIPTDADE